MTLPNNFIWNQTVKDAASFVEEYGIDRCLIAAKKLADDVDSDRMSALFDADESSCASKLILYACAHCGIRQLYAALLFCSGNYLGADFQYRAYQFAAAQSSRDINKLFLDEEYLDD